MQCEKGSFAGMIDDQKEFEQLPDWLDRQKCTPVTKATSSSSCIFHQRKWRSHLDSIRADTGIPEGTRFSIGGSKRIGADKDGAMGIEYETFRLRAGESFSVFIDS